nr:hypothetical protein [Dyadobacter sp. NIV53]
MDEAHRFDFVSVGDKHINKTVVFQQIDKTQFYNLVLADVDSDGELDVFAVSNNGDMKKILATVLQCIEMFLTSNFKATIIFYGSTSLRTNIYQWVINRELAKASLRFFVQGFDGANFVDFNPKDKYSAFAISLKNR